MYIHDLPLLKKNKGIYFLNNFEISERIIKDLDYYLNYFYDKNLPIFLIKDNGNKEYCGILYNFSKEHNLTIIANGSNVVSNISVNNISVKLIARYEYKIKSVFKRLLNKLNGNLFKDSEKIITKVSSIEEIQLLRINNQDNG